MAGYQRGRVRARVGAYRRRVPLTAVAAVVVPPALVKARVFRSVIS